MKIEINKDYESEFKKTVWKGLTMRELLTGVAAFLASAVTAVLVWRLTGLPVNVCTYIGMPWMLVIGGLGLLRYQGATMPELWREMRYTWKTGELSGETDAFRKTRTFTMRPERHRGTHKGTRKRTNKGTHKGGKKHGSI